MVKAEVMYWKICLNLKKFIWLWEWSLEVEDGLFVSGSGVVWRLGVLMKSYCAEDVLGLIYFQTYGILVSPGIYFRAGVMWHLKDVEELSICSAAWCILVCPGYTWFVFSTVCGINLLFNIVKDTWVLFLKSTHKGMVWARLFGKRSEDNEKQFIFAFITNRPISSLCLKIS